MFRLPVNSTALTTEVANGFFTNIQGESFKGDISFVSTLRALIHPRMEDGDSLHLSFNEFRFNTNDVNEYTPKQIVERTCERFNLHRRGEVGVCSVLSGEKEADTELLNIIKANFARVNNGWHRLTKVTDLFRTQFYILCFVNPELKSVTIFVESLTLSKLHYLQCAILGFFPWYFSPEKGVSQEEMDLINSLRGKDKSIYLGCISQLSQRYDFRVAKIKQQLAGFETRYEQRELANMRTKIEHTDNNINSYNREIANLLQARRDYEIKALGLEAKIARGDSESEIMEYFIHNKKLDLDYVDSEDMQFIVKDYITYFDEESAKRVINNPDSYVYSFDSRGHDDYILDNKVKELMNAIFIDQIIKIKVCAAYNFRLTGNVQGISGYHFGDEYSGYMPNPHIQNHSCMGNYSTPINEALQRNDYIYAIEQTMASAKSLNFNDSIVMKGFMRSFYGIGYSVSEKERQRWFELPDGTLLTSTEAADWIWNQNHPAEQEVGDNE